MPSRTQNIPHWHHQGITFTMIVSRSGTRRGFENESTSEGSRSLRPNIPLQNMAIKITTEVDRDADSTNQRDPENLGAEYNLKGSTLPVHGGAPTSLPSDVKYSPDVSFEGDTR